MFKCFISFILGFFAGFMFFISFITGSPIWLVGSVIVTVICMALALVIGHRIHKRMKNKHEIMIRNGGAKYHI